MDNHSWLNKELYLVPYLEVTVIKSVLVLIITNPMDSTRKRENAAHQKRDPWDRIQLVWILMKNSKGVSTSALSLMRAVVQRSYLKRGTLWSIHDFTSLQRKKKSLCFSAVEMLLYLVQLHNECHSLWFKCIMPFSQYPERRGVHIAFSGFHTWIKGKLSQCSELLMSCRWRRTSSNCLQQEPT